MKMAPPDAQSASIGSAPDGDENMTDSSGYAYDEEHNLADHPVTDTDDNDHDNMDSDNSNEHDDAMNASIEDSDGNGAGNPPAPRNDSSYDGDVEDCVLSDADVDNNDGGITPNNEATSPSNNAEGGLTVESVEDQNRQAVRIRTQALETLGSSEDNSTLNWCIYCMEDETTDDELVFVSLGTPCEHQACTKCLNKYASRTLVSRLSYPPMCACTEENMRIDLVALKDHLNDDIRARFLARVQELTSDNPTWCFVKTCSNFLIDDVAENVQFLHCDKCGEHTCNKCKGLKTDHFFVPGSDPTIQCPELLSQEDQALIAAKHWKQCPNETCRVVIDRHEGCNVMLCTSCGTKFCWKCDFIFDPDPNVPGCACYDDEPEVIGETLVLVEGEGEGENEVRVQLIENIFAEQE